MDSNFRPSPKDEMQCKYYVRGHPCAICFECKHFMDGCYKGQEKEIAKTHHGFMEFTDDMSFEKWLELL